jgi:hypothetical protein
MAKEKGQSPTYDHGRLLDAYISLMEDLRQMWAATVEVFNTDHDNLGAVRRRDIINMVAPRLFDCFAQACNLTVLSGIAAMLDPPHSTGNLSKANLVLRRVIDDLAPPEGTPERAAIEKGYAEAIALARPILHARDKLGAHNDLLTNRQVTEHYLFNTAYPMKNVTVGEIDEIMLRLNRITDAIVAKHRPGTQWYEREIEVKEFFMRLYRGKCRASVLMEKEGDGPPTYPSDL